MFFSSVPFHDVRLRWSRKASVAFVALVGACNPRPVEATPDASATPDAAVAAATSPPPACEGPEFAFADQDRLVWATRGLLRQHDGAYAIELNAPLIFTSTKYGKVTSKFVTLVCTDCTREQWEAFEGGLAPLQGKSVRAKGIVRPAWSRPGDAGVSKDAPAVQLSTTLRDVIVLGDSEPKVAPVCGGTGASDHPTAAKPTPE